MLAERVKEWQREWKEAGLEEGRQEGRQEGQREGVQQGAARMLLQQLEAKFGELTAEQRHRVETADAETLLEWSQRLLTAQSLEEVWQ